MTSVTPPTWVKHRQFEARLAVITEHEPTVNDCASITRSDLAMAPSLHNAARSIIADARTTAGSAPHNVVPSSSANSLQIAVRGFLARSATGRALAGPQAARRCLWRRSGVPLAMVGAG